MTDKEAIKLLTGMLTKYPLADEEKEAIREAIGILSWSKLMEGWTERKKRVRDKRAEEI